MLFTVVYFIIIRIVSSQFLSGDPVSNQLLNYSLTHFQPRNTFIETSFGTPVSDITTSLTVGRKGPILLSDTVFHDVISHFNRERIPERVVHPRGSGAFGYFEVRSDITRYTKAKVFERVGKRTRVAVRFSLATAVKELPETIRIGRGFALRFYTDEGIWDIVGYNFPVFLLRDPIQFPTLVHSGAKNPQTGITDPNMNWDFLTQHPESVHNILRLFSSEIPDGWRFVDGFGQHTFKMVNTEGGAVYVKFHYLNDQGFRSLTPERARNITATDPFYFPRDLYNAIGRGDYPSWTFYIQVMTFQQAKTFRWDPFDVTKLWPEEDYPLIEVGRFVLNENPKNFFEDIGNLNFCPCHMVPGIEPSPDRMLHGRIFAYKDAQIYRLSSNMMQVRVNRPFQNRFPTNYERDGRDVYYNQNGAPNYYPNSFNGPENNPRGAISPYPVCGDVDRHDNSDNDNFSQSRILWNSFTAEQRQALVNNLASALSQVYPFIQRRAIQMFSNVSTTFSRMLEEAIAETAATRKETRVEESAK